MKNYKLTKSRVETYLQHLREGKLRGQAAALINVSPDAVRKYAVRDAEFRAAIEAAEMDACEPIENALYTSAVDGNLGAQIFWLTNRGGGRWQNTQRTQTEHSGEVTFKLVEEDE